MSSPYVPQHPYYGDITGVRRTKNSPFPPRHIRGRKRTTSLDRYKYQHPLYPPSTNAAIYDARQPQDFVDKRQSNHVLVAPMDHNPRHSRDPGGFYSHMGNYPGVNPPSVEHGQEQKDMPSSPNQAGEVTHKCSHNFRHFVQVVLPVTCSCYDVRNTHT